MGDMGDLYNEMKKEGQKRRANNREKSSDWLVNEEIPFKSKNMGAHLIVEGFECYIDFWPGTGRWISRNGKRGFGVKNLIRHIKKGI